MKTCFVINLVFLGSRNVYWIYSVRKSHSGLYWYSISSGCYCGNMKKRLTTRSIEYISIRSKYWFTAIHNVTGEELMRRLSYFYDGYKPHKYYIRQIS